MRPHFRPRRSPPLRLELLEERCVLATLVGLTTTNNLVRFDSGGPWTVTTVGAISGVASGQSLVALDFRPQTGGLYGLGFGSGAGQLYQVNPTTAAAAAVGTPFSTTLSGTQFGFSFDPVADTIRVTDTAGDNLRVNPTTGALVATDTSIASGNSIVALANDRNLRGATQTTLFGYNLGNNHLVTVGSVNGSPNSPNGGSVTDIGSSGVSATGNVGFAIDADGKAYLSLNVSGTDGLYTDNLSTGAATLVGAIGGDPLRDLTAAPAVSFTVSGFPTPRTAGLAATVTVTANTVYNTTATRYSGTVHITSTDTSAILPANNTLTSGAGTFSVTLNSANVNSLNVPFSITATDTVNSAITGAENNIFVLPNTELVGVTTGNKLVRFFSDAPGTLTTIGTITGLTAGQNVVGLAFRPANAGLYAMGFASGTGQLYTINPTTAAATAVGSPFSTTLTGTDFGFDFDPVNDVIRVTDDKGENLRVNPNTGAFISNDTALSPSGVSVVALAYSNNIAGTASSTLYGYNSANDHLVSLGTVTGTTNAPNSGVVSDIGASGVTTTTGTAGDIGFALDAAGGAYLNLVTGSATASTSGLYTANLSTGAVALNGSFGGTVMRAVSVAPIVGLKIVPPAAQAVVGAVSPFTVQSVNVYGDPTPGYEGVAKLSTDDPNSSSPGNAGFPKGSGTLFMQFANPGTFNLTVSDEINTSLKSSTTVTVVNAVIVYGVGSDGRLLSISTGAVGSPNTSAFVGNINGLAQGQHIVSVDVRPASGELYGLAFGGGAGQLYRINRVTAAVTPVGTPFALTGSHFSMGFDPVNDVVRVISDGGDNLRIKPVTGAVIAGDPALSPASVYAGLAYSNNFFGATTTMLFSYDYTHNEVVTINPGTGQVTVLGPSGVTADPGTAGDVGFDIGHDGIGYLSLVVGGQCNLYTLNLGTGAVQLVDGRGGFGSDLVGLSAAVPGGQDKIGVVRANTDRTAVISLDSNGDGVFDSGDAVFSFGLSTDTFLVGDWAGLGYDSLGVVRPGPNGVAQFSLDTNGNNTFDRADQVFSFGLNTDTFLAGDWNGSGTTKIGVVRPGANGVAVFSLDTNGDGTFDASDTVTSFGLNTDTFLVGDWNGDGRAKIGVVRPGPNGVAIFSLDTNGDGVFDSGDQVFSFGLNSDTFLVGDWNGDGRAKIGVVRGLPDGTAVFSLDIDGNGIFDSSDSVFHFGVATDRFIVGKWKLPATAALLSADGFLSGPPVSPLVIDATFLAAENQAIASWQQAGLDPADVARLEIACYGVAALGGSLIGETSGNDITLDATAAGHGWSETPVPQSGQLDLETALAHEMGHVLGLPDQTTQPDDVMFATLPPGVRKAPTAQDVDAVFAAVGR
jgi:hypothetical protein